MKTILDEVKAIPNRSMEIANLYHKQSLELINLALTHSKLAIEASHNSSTELIQVKDPKNLHALVTSHMSSQIRDYLNFATAAYQLGFNAQAQAVNIFQQQLTDNRSLTNDFLKCHSPSGNPVSTIAASIINSALHTSQSVIDSAKASVTQTAELTKSKLSSK